jgi:hypothetical protein
VCITWSNRFCSGSIKSIRTLKPLWSVSVRICYRISLKSCNINHLLMEKPLQCKCKRLQNSVDRHFPYMFVWEEKGMANWSKKKTEIWCIVLGAPSCYVERMNQWSKQCGVTLESWSMPTARAGSHKQPNIRFIACNVTLLWQYILTLIQCCKHKMWR